MSHIIKSIAILLLCVFILSPNASAAENADYGSHPRLLLTKDDMTKVDSLICNSITFQNLHNHIIAISDGILSKPVLKRDLTGKRLLSVSREAVKRICHLAYAYRFTLNKKYADRAIDEIMEICQFTDWNPSHFLDVAEMTMAVAIGYDWLYDLIDDKNREIIVDAVINKSFIPSLNDKESRFINECNNWNQVCNASLLYGAISFIDDAPRISSKIINRCISSNPKALSMYSPDGGYPEGYNYWGYGTMYQTLLIDALEKTYGHDFGLMSIPGFKKTGYFIQFMATPTGECFNFGDSPTRSKGNIPLFWFAYKNNDPSLAYLEFNLLNEQRYVFEEDKFLPIIPIFASRLNNDTSIPPDRRFWVSMGETPVFIYRSGWDNKTDTYLGIKGGSPSTSHAHMDAGSFIFENNGVRWATDLGMQDYNSLESKGIKLWDKRQNGERWNIMRMRNDCHNTLTIDSARHIVKSNADIIETFNSDTRKGAVINLTSTLGKIKMAHREVSLDRNDNLCITDSIQTSDNSIQLTWVMVTAAEASVTSPNSILLKKSGKEMLMTVESPVNLNIHIWPNTPIHDYDAPNPGSVRVGFSANIPANKNAIFKTKLNHIETPSH